MGGGRGREGLDLVTGQLLVRPSVARPVVLPPTEEIVATWERLRRRPRGLRGPILVGDDPAPKLYRTCDPAGRSVLVAVFPDRTLLHDGWDTWRRHENPTAEQLAAYDIIEELLEKADGYLEAAASIAAAAGVTLDTSEYVRGYQSGGTSYWVSSTGSC